MEKSDFVPKAAIGETTYATLTEAIAAVRDGETITLLDDVADEAIKIAPESRISFVLDLAGRTISESDPDAGAIEIAAPVDLTITGNGTVTHSEGTCIEFGDDEEGGGSLTIKDGIFKAYYASIYVGNYWDVTIRIQDGKFHSEDSCAIGTGEDCETVITGGSFTSEQDVAAWFDGPATISGGSFTSEQGSAALFNGPVAIRGGNFTGKDCAVYLDNNALATLSGGTFTAEAPNPAFYIQALDISAGHFSSVVTAPGYHLEPADWKTASFVMAVPNDITVPYHITYDANGMSGTPPVDNTSYQYGEGAVVLAPDELVEEDGREFLCWNLRPDNSGMAYRPGGTLSVEGDTVLYAIYGRGYAITYDANTAEPYSGELPAPKRYLAGVGAPVAKNCLIREGWFQGGWTSEPDGGDFYYGVGLEEVAQIDRDITFYAKWFRPAAVRYDAGLPEDASEAEKQRLEALLPVDTGLYSYGFEHIDPAYPSDLQVLPPKSGFEREGFFFAGWEGKGYSAVSPGESIWAGNIEQERKPDGSPVLVLRARWVEESAVENCIFHFDANLPVGQTLEKELPDIFTQKGYSYDFVDVPVPVCADYLFTGWRVNGNPVEKISWNSLTGYDSYFRFSNELEYTFTAQWTPKSDCHAVTVVWKNADGSTHIGTDGLPCIVEGMMPYGTELSTRRSDFPSFGLDNYLGVSYWWRGREIYRFTVEQDMEILARPEGVSLRFCAGDYGLLRPSSGGTLTNAIIGTADARLPLAETSTVGIPEPVPDAGYRFVGWNARMGIKIIYGRSLPIRGAGRSLEPLEPELDYDKAFYFYSNVDPATFVLSSRYEGSPLYAVTFTAMFARDTVPGGGDDPGPGPGGNTSGGSGGSTPEPPKRLLKPLVKPKPLETATIEEKPIPMTGDGSLPDLALLMLAASGGALLLTRRRRS